MSATRWVAETGRTQKKRRSYLVNWFIKSEKGGGCPPFLDTKGGKNLVKKRTKGQIKTGTLFAQMEISKSGKGILLRRAGGKERAKKKGRIKSVHDAADGSVKGRR